MNIKYVEEDFEELTLKITLRDLPNFDLSLPSFLSPLPSLSFSLALALFLFLNVVLAVTYFRNLPQRRYLEFSRITCCQGANNPVTSILT